MNKVPAETVNERIIRIRKALKKSPAEFAAILSISRSYIYGLENTRRVVNERFMKLIAYNFGVNERWLKTGQGEMFNDSESENCRKIQFLFGKLRPDFQEYVLSHISLLLELQDKCGVGSYE